jgi:hypothetical protein
MFVNAILHHKVLRKNENWAKFFAARALAGSSFGSRHMQGPIPGGIKFWLMSEAAPTPQGPTNSGEGKQSEADMFATRPAEGGGVPVAAWLVAGVVVLAIVIALMFSGQRKTSGNGNTIQPLAAYAANLPTSQFAMSESTSLSGGKSTFVDGHIQNTGNQTVTGITVQVIFNNDEAMPPHIETLPLALIRTREPYIDTQPVSANPLKPGDERDFRLIFESIPNNWNVQMPEVHIVQVTTK